jgi:hypothetical protein
VQTTLRHRFAIGNDAFWRDVFFHRPFVERLYREALGATSFEILSETGDLTSGLSRRLRFTQTVDAPAAVRKLFGESTTMQEEGRFPVAEREGGLLEVRRDANPHAAHEHDLERLLLHRPGHLDECQRRHLRRRLLPTPTSRGIRLAQRRPQPPRPPAQRLLAQAVSTRELPGCRPLERFHYSL